VVRRRFHELLPVEENVTDLSNVLPFERAKGTPPTLVPPVELDADDRPSQLRREPRRQLGKMAVIAASMLLHVGALALFLRTPEPAPGIGLEAISVEVVFGANTPAGLASAAADQEVQLQPPSAPEEPVTKQEPEELEPALETASAIPPPDPEAPARHETEDKQRKKEKIMPPSRPASGVGRGQSRRDANYHGRVAAHLARHKRFPESAQSQRDQGTAVVSFSLDGGGRLTAVKLIRSSGVRALDQEAQAMVRRASPFPPPPAGTASFTVPLTFQIK
jgi:protein TonB